jgi:hypothetical protein
MVLLLSFNNLFNEDIERISSGRHYTLKIFGDG